MNKYTIAAAAAFLCAAGAAHAAPVALSTGNVEINFDDENAYSAEILSYYSGSLYYTTTLSGYSGVGNGLVISAGLSNSLGGSGYADGGYVNFNLHDISFTAQAGYVITGYRFTFTGTAESFGDGYYEVGASSGWASFSGTSYTLDSGVLPSFPDTGFAGWVSLEAPYLSNDDGTAAVYGTAFGSIDTITVEAITQPVPEPETYALLGLGLASVMVAARRRKA